jgi:hypothetical protein
MEGLIWPRERRKNKKGVGGMDKEMGRCKREEEERQEEDREGKED